jgi:hypothetical protein
MKLTAAYLFSPSGIMSDSNAPIDEREIEETYNCPQAVIDSLYEEGDMDYIFLCDLLENFDNASCGERAQERTDFSTSTAFGVASWPDLK